MSFLGRGGFQTSPCTSPGCHFWARGYFVSTVGRDEKAVREYIRKQEAEFEILETKVVCSIMLIRKG